MILLSKMQEYLAAQKVAAGVTFAFLEVRIVPVDSLLGAITFAFYVLGVWLSNRFGERYRAKAELIGDIILILMGTKILLFCQRL